MKAIICDTCGKISPDSFGVEILPLNLKYGSNPPTQIERDICPECLTDLIKFFEPTQTGAPEVKEVKSDVPAEAIEQTTFEVEKPDPGECIATFIAPVKIVELKEDAGTGKVYCQYCKKPFTPRSKKSKFCSHKCENRNWMEKKKKQKQDEVLNKLKRENPLNEAPEPSIYREM